VKSFEKLLKDFNAHSLCVVCVCAWVKGYHRKPQIYCCK